MSARAALAALLVVAAVAVGAAVVSQRTDPERVRAAAEAPVATVAPADDAPADDADAGGGDVDPAEDRPVVDLPVLETAAPPVTADRWLNTDPITAQELVGKVVLYEFWTYGCSNCQAVQPHLAAWWERYRGDGLVIIGVHSPEFDHEADPQNVADYVTDQDIAWPVALDPEKRVWRAWDQHFWPNIYVNDRQGRRRYTHGGEGAYAETEDVLRTLLDVDPSSPRADPVP